MALPLELLVQFPGLASGYKKTSEPDHSYNCIAHAAGDKDVWWDPAPRMYWPSRVPRDYSLGALEAAFASIGYVPCDSDALEQGVDKVALFIGGDGRYTHAARQLEDGRWTSKLGPNEDISHELRQVEGSAYGTVARLMKKARR